MITEPESSLPSLEGLPADLSKELILLESLNKKELLAVARETFPRSKQRRLSRLLQMNQAGILSNAEKEILDKLVEMAERLMLRKARANVLLKWRERSRSKSIKGGE